MPAIATELFSEVTPWWRRGGLTAAGTYHYHLPQYNINVLYTARRFLGRWMERIFWGLATSAVLAACCKRRWNVRMASRGAICRLGLLSFFSLFFFYSFSHCNASFLSLFSSFSFLSISLVSSARLYSGLVLSRSLRNFCQGLLRLKHPAISKLLCSVHIVQVYFKYAKSTRWIEFTNGIHKCTTQ